MRYWVTRLRAYTPVVYKGADGRSYVRQERTDWSPGDPHLGYAEFEDGQPTGQVSGEGAVVEHKDVAVPVESQSFYVRYRELVEQFREKTPMDNVHVERVEPRPVVPLRLGVVYRHSGLRRNLKVEDKLRGMLDKAENGRLSDSELSMLLVFWGVQVRATEIIGQRFDLAHQAAKAAHDALVEEATNRVWTQSLLDLIGAQVERMIELMCPLSFGDI